jgi:hypothetical protein
MAMGAEHGRQEYQNPLLAPILAQLLADDPVYKLHELMQRLASQGCLPDWETTAEIQLFRTNFLLMNGLYQLQQQLQECGTWLHVAPLALHLVPISVGNSWLQQADPLRDYYLDWRNCFVTTQQDIETLLHDFWQRYSTQPALSAQMRCQALATLGLTDTATYPMIRQRWKQLALQHHPDRQGDALQFMAIRLAWEQLRDTR